MTYLAPRHFLAPLCLASLACLTSALVAQTVWTGGASGTGMDYNTASNWDSGLPENDGINDGNNRDGLIENASVSYTNRSHLVNDNLTIGTGGSVSGGRVDLYRGNYALEFDGQLTTNGSTAIGIADSSVIVGRASSTDTALMEANDIRLGDSAQTGSGAFLTMNSGTINTRKHFELRGTQAATYVQNGGDLNITSQLQVESATANFTLNNGTVDAQRIVMSGGGTLTTTGGALTSTNRIDVNGSSNLQAQGGLINAVTLDLNGSSNTQRANASFSGDALANFSGQLDNLRGNLLIQDNAVVNAAGSIARADSTTRVEGNASLTLNGDFRMTGSNSVFNQAGNSTTSLSGLNIENTAASYNLAGGNLIAQSVTANGSYNQTGGLARIGATGSGVITVTGQVNLSGGIMERTGTTNIRNGASFNWEDGGTLRSIDGSQNLAMNVDNGGTLIARDNGGGAAVLDLSRVGSSTNQLIVGGASGTLDLDALTIDLYDVADLIPRPDQVAGDPLGIESTSAQVDLLSDDTLVSTADPGLQGAILLVEARALEKTNFNIDDLLITNLTGLDPDVSYLGEINITPGFTQDDVLDQFGVSITDRDQLSYAWTEVTDTGIVLRYNVLEPIPEPSQLSLIGLALLGALRQRKRR